MARKSRRINGNKSAIDSGVQLKCLKHAQVFT